MIRMKYARKGLLRDWKAVVPGDKISMSDICPRKAADLSPMQTTSDAATVGFEPVLSPVVEGVFSALLSNEMYILEPGLAEFVVQTKPTETLVQVDVLRASLEVIDPDPRIPVILPALVSLTANLSVDYNSYIRYVARGYGLTLEEVYLNI